MSSIPMIFWLSFVAIYIILEFEGISAEEDPYIIYKRARILPPMKMKRQFPPNDWEVAQRLYNDEAASGIEKRGRTLIPFLYTPGSRRYRRDYGGGYEKRRGPLIPMLYGRHGRSRDDGDDVITEKRP